MLKMFVNDIELIPVSLGAQEGQKDEKEALVLNFQSEKGVHEIIEMFRALPDDTVVKIENEKRVKVFTGYVSLGETMDVKGNTDGSYDYTVYLHQKSALDIAKQAAADVEYLAAVSGVEL